MCFSANASFAASGVLAITGAAAIHETKSKRGLLYAFIPLLFALQQFIEGWQWVVGGVGPWAWPLAYGFLFFATILWPVYVPLSVYLIESESERKARLGYFVFLGAAVSLFTLINLLLYPIGVTATACCHVIYSFVLPYKYVVGASYVVATCGSMFFSSHGWVRTMSVVTFLAFVTAFIFATAAYVSVWCFLAAIISLLVLIHTRSQNTG